VASAFFLQTIPDEQALNLQFPAYHALDQNCRVTLEQDR